MKPKAYSYIRFSSKPQELGRSRKRQIELSEKLCEKHGLELDTSLRLQDLGKSAFHGKHLKTGGGLAGFVEAFKAGRVKPGSWLILESLDRFSRQKPRIAMQLLLELVNGGLTIATASPERIYNAETADADMMPLMEIQMIATRANEESETKSGRTKDAYAAELQEAKAGRAKVQRRCPSWLVRVGNTFELLPERVKLVEEIFRMARTQGSRAITKALNRRKVKPWGSKKMNKSGAWGWAMVQNILSDGTAIGRFTSNTGVTIENYYPRIISDADFEAIEQLRAKRTKWSGRIGTKVANLFQGIAYDVQTGSTMTTVKKAANKPWRFTPSAYETATDEGAATFPYDLFEQEFLRFTSELSAHDIDGKAIKFVDQSPVLEAELGRIEARLEALARALEESSDLPEVLKAISSLRAKKQELAQQLQEAKDKASGRDGSALHACKSLTEALSKAKGEELVEARLNLRANIRALVDKIEVEIIRFGWVYVLHAHVQFKTGAVRRMSIGAERGQLIFSMADTEAALSDKGRAITLNVKPERLAQAHKIMVEVQKWMQASLANSKKIIADCKRQIKELEA